MQLRKPSYKTNGGEVRQSARWHVRFRDHLNTRRRVPAFTDKRMSEKLGEKLDGLAARVRAGEPLGDIEKWVDTLPGDLRDRLIGWGLLSRETRLDELVDAYHEAQLDKDTSERTAGETRRRILRVFTGCGFAFFRDIDAEIVTAWLREQRDSGTAKATSNAWLAAARSFCNWMVKRGAVVKSPLLAADPVPNNDGRAFGCFTQDQVRQLLAHCVAASSVWGLKQREPVGTRCQEGITHTGPHGRPGRPCPRNAVPARCRDRAAGRVDTEPAGCAGDDRAQPERHCTRRHDPDHQRPAEEQGCPRSTHPRTAGHAAGGTDRRQDARRTSPGRAAPLGRDAPAGLVRRRAATDRRGRTAVEVPQLPGERGHLGWRRHRQRQVRAVTHRASDTQHRRPLQPDDETDAARGGRVAAG